MCISRTFTCRGLTAAALVFAFISVWGQDRGQSEARYGLKAIYLPDEVRPSRKYEPRQLPFKEYGGDLPQYDGEQFHINVFNASVQDEGEAAKILTQFVQSLSPNTDAAKLIQFSVRKSTNPADGAFVESEIAAASKQRRSRLGNQNSETAQSIFDEEAAELKRSAAEVQTIYRFDQYFDQTLIDHAGLLVTDRGREGTMSVQGRFFDDVNVLNRPAGNGDETLQRAVVELQRKYKLQRIEIKEKPTLVLLPYGDGFRYAWKSVIVADGPYKIWVDAEEAQILELLPDFYFSDNAKGLTFYPYPPTTKELTFEVNPASGGKFTLKLDGIMTMTNTGTDGTSGVVSIDAGSATTANFNVSPINGTSISNTSAADYNGLFQQVNAYAHIFDQRKYYLLLGSQAFTQIDITVNNEGRNAFCCPPSFHIGDATTGSTDPLRAFNSGIDATVVTHEFGHWLNDIQFKVGGGTLHGAINEGLADFWACSRFDTALYAGFYGQPRGAARQDGLSPREAEATDIFPDRNSAGTGASNEVHSAGQLTNWANWSAREGMNELIDFGRLSMELCLVKAMTTAGVGITSAETEKSVHDAHIDLLKQQATYFRNSRLLNKLLAGYARAGFFLSDRDAIIDISDSYLDRAATTGPVFTIWTGRDYTFSGSSTSTASPPFNTEYMVEVCNAENFASGVVSSGWLGGVTAGAGGSATWTLPAADWTTLKAANQIYYRVTTRSGEGVNIRQSWKPGNAFLNNTKVGKAAINGTGSKDCACSAGSSSSTGMVMLPVLPIFGLVVYRIRQRKQAKVRQ